MNSYRFFFQIILDTTTQCDVQLLFDSDVIVTGIQITSKSNTSLVHQFNVSYSAKASWTTKDDYRDTVGKNSSMHYSIQ